jgi:hypothetical protein
MYRYCLHIEGKLSKETGEGGIGAGARKNDPWNHLKLKKVLTYIGFRFTIYLLEDNMAVQASAGKIYVGIKLPNVNYRSIESIIAKQGGSVASYINEAVYEWLKARGLEAEVSIDGRTGKWVRVVDDKKGKQSEGDK